MNKKSNTKIEAEIWFDDDGHTLTIEFKSNYDMHRYVGAMVHVGLIDGAQIQEILR